MKSQSIARRICTALACSALLASGGVLAACPFIGSASDALNDGIVLTRYALGLSSTALTQRTRYASLDAMQMERNIACYSNQLDMTGDGSVLVADATIIARYLFGFRGAALTTGLTLGVGSRKTSDAVAKFIADGCPC